MSGISPPLPPFVKGGRGGGIGAGYPGGKGAGGVRGAGKEGVESGISKMAVCGRNRKQFKWHCVILCDRKTQKRQELARAEPR